MKTKNVGSCCKWEDRINIRNTNLTLFCGLCFQPNIPDVSEVLDDVVLDVGAAVVFGRLPPEGAARLSDVDNDGTARRRRRGCLFTIVGLVYNRGLLEMK